MSSSLKLKALQSIYLPASGPARDPAQSKVVLALHGLGDSCEGYRFLPQFIGRTDIAYLLLNAPDSYYMGYSWFTIPGNIEPGIVRSRSLVKKSFEELFVLGYKSENIALFGFSQGCAVSVDFALRSPWKLAGVVGISGFIPFLERYPAEFGPCAKQQKLFISHGDEDPLLPIDLTRGQVEELGAKGISVEWHEYNKEHTIDPGNERKDLQRFFDKIF